MTLTLRRLLHRSNLWRAATSATRTPRCRWVKGPEWACLMASDTRSVRARPKTSALTVSSVAGGQPDAAAPAGLASAAADPPPDLPTRLMAL